jgi:cytochrome c oxidase subunit 1
MAAVHEHDVAHDAHDLHPSGASRWICATNHKDICTMYLWFAFTMFLTWGVMALTIRAELFQPGIQVVNPEFFNQLTTMHGLIMVFGAIMPAFVGFANWQVPMMIGAPDMAFARMNNWSFWLLPPAALLLTGSFFVPGGAPAGGWTIYPPSPSKWAREDVAIFVSHHGRIVHYGLHYINTNIPNMRTWHDADENAAVRVTTDHRSPGAGNAGAGAVTMLPTDRNFGTTFNAGGGDWSCSSIFSGSLATRKLHITSCRHSNCA